MRILALAAMTALAAPALADQPVTINFAAEMAGTPFTCAQAYHGNGVTESTVELSATGLPVTDEANRGWALHLGSTGCASEARTVPPTEACANPNLLDVRFDSFDPAANTVIFDVAPVLAEANVDMTTSASARRCSDVRCAGRSGPTSVL